MIQAESLAEPLVETAVPTDTPAPSFVSVWDSARQAAERWQGRSPHEEDERWPTTQDFPEGARPILFRQSLLQQ
jgi:hypothetical protein